MSGKLTLERHPLDPGRGGARGARDHAAGGRGEADRAPRGVRSPGDHRRRRPRAACSRSLTNLLSNAVKFTAQGGVIAPRSGSRASTVQLAVRDNGAGHRAGVPAARVRAVHAGRYLDHAPCRRARDRPRAGPATSSSCTAGRCARRARASGCGATFIVDLPAPAIAWRRAVPAPAARRGRGGPPPERTQGAVVDDDPDARDVIGLALRQAGRGVEAFESGDALLAALERADRAARRAAARSRDARRGRLRGAGARTHARSGPRGGAGVRACPPSRCPRSPRSIGSA